MHQTRYRPWLISYQCTVYNYRQFRTKNMSDVANVYRYQAQNVKKLFSA